MIYFYCPECKEELEAEDSIRGVRMKCPACAREIEVPQASVKMPTARAGIKKGEYDLPSPEAPAALPGARFIIIILVAGTVGLLALTGVGYYLTERAREARLRALPKCDICAGKKKVACVRCAGARTMPCEGCKGAGVRKNVRDEDEPCYVCRGGGRNDCPICAGRGEYSCAACAGTGLRDKR